MPFGWSSSRRRSTRSRSDRPTRETYSNQQYEALYDKWEEQYTDAKELIRIDVGDEYAEDIAAAYGLAQQYLSTFERRYNKDMTEEQARRFRQTRDDMRDDTDRLGSSVRRWKERWGVRN